MRVESRLRADRDHLFAVSSYAITTVRVLIAMFGALTIVLTNNIWLAVASIVFVMAFDYFDGATFEKSNLSMNKRWRIRRRIADSLSDRLVIQIVCIPLLIKSPSFAWLYLLILAREIVISGYLYKQFDRGLLVYPRSIAKIACAMVGLAVISFLVSQFSFTFITAAVMITLSAFALLDYIRRVHTHKTSIPITQPNGSLEEIF